MAEIVNLRLARKARDRDAAARQAATNRAQHGESKGEKLRRKQEAERLAKTVDGARRPEGREDD